MTIVTVILLILAFLIWGILLSMIGTMNSSDAAGNGMAYGFAFILAIALWILLAVLMIVAVRRGEIPGWAKLAAVVLLPLSYAAAAATISLLANSGVKVSGWPIVVPAMIPPLILAYVMWNIIPSLRAAVSPTTMSGIVWAPVLVLSLLPWPMLKDKDRRLAAARAEYETRAKAEQDSSANALKSGFESLTADTPLREWLAFATAGNDMREQTLEGIRKLPTRQAQAEAMRGSDMENMMYELRNLGLKATPALCSSATDFLAAHAMSFQDKAATTARYEIEGASIERYLFAMEWLSSNGCDLTPALDAYDAVVRLFPGAPDREQFLSRIASLRSTR